MNTMSKLEGPLKPFGFLAQLGGKDASTIVLDMSDVSPQLKEKSPSVVIRPASIVTNMDVDRHQFDVRERRRISRAMGTTM